MAKVSQEVKKLADKYCDEHGGPPKKEEPSLIGMDYAGIEARMFAWMDECAEIPLLDWAKLYPPTKIHCRPGTKFVATLPTPKLTPEKPWIKFNPTPKNPKRGLK